MHDRIYDRPAPPGFGKPGSIRPERFASLPRPMQREGLLILAEMRAPAADQMRATGMSLFEIMDLRDRNLDPWRLVQPDFTMAGDA